MIPKKIYLTKKELQDTITCERMVSIDEPYKDITEEYVNLSQVWHDVSEEPKKYPILCEDEKNRVWIDHNLKDYIESWDIYVEFCEIIRWAYINDLLPKGSEK